MGKKIRPPACAGGLTNLLGVRFLVLLGFGRDPEQITVLQMKRFHEHVSFSGEISTRIDVHDRTAIGIADMLIKQGFRPVIKRENREH